MTEKNVEARIADGSTDVHRVRANRLTDPTAGTLRQA